MAYFSFLLFWLIVLVEYYPPDIDSFALLRISQDTGIKIGNTYGRVINTNTKQGATSPKNINIRGTGDKNNLEE